MRIVAERDLQARAVASLTEDLDRAALGLVVVLALEGDERASGSLSTSLQPLSIRTNRSAVEYASETEYGTSLDAFANANDNGNANVSANENA